MERVRKRSIWGKKKGKEERISMIIIWVDGRVGEKTALIVWSLFRWP